MLALILIPVFPHFLSPNEFSRWAAAAAIVDDHTLSVNRLMPLLGDRLEDLSQVGDRIYSNKAPGLAFVGLPAYAAARAIVGPPSAATMRPTLTAMRWLAATVPAILLAMLFAGAAARFGASRERVATAVVALLFGTPLFAYGLLNFSHALTAFALFAAWLLLFVRPTAWGEVGAGALIGLAVISEYPCVFAGAVLVAFAVAPSPGLRPPSPALRERDAEGPASFSRDAGEGAAKWRMRALRIILGGVPFALALALYNRAAFGSAFTLSSAHERDAAFRGMAGEGLFGIGVPNLGTLVRLLLDPSKGLLLFSPIILMAMAMLPRAYRAMTARQLGSLVATPAVLILLYAGYPNWHGGWTVGARYLVPALPFLLFPLVFAAESIVESLLLGASVAACVVTSIVFPFVPPGIPAPWGTFALPLLARGLIAPNLFHLIARPPAIAVPAVIVIAAVWIGTRKRLFVALGAVASLGIATYIPLTPIARLQRAFIEEVSFERPNAIAEEAGDNPAVGLALLRRAVASRTQPPPTWPF
jgi:hypothetical protein